MHSLQEIKYANSKAATDARTHSKFRTENAHNRHCSYLEKKDGSIILHSAKQRSTAFISAGNYAKNFLAQWFGTNSAEKRDKIVEAYFT